MVKIQTRLLQKKSGLLPSSSLIVSELLRGETGVNDHWKRIDVRYIDFNSCRIADRASSSLTIENCRCLIVDTEYATSANSFPLKIAGTSVRIHTRRPAAWHNLLPMDAALLDFLRSRGQLSELTPLETKQKLLAYFHEDGRFKRLMEVIATEPPRVRAMVGAIGQEIGQQEQSLEVIRQSLNPISKFDFGILSNLQYAQEWQAK